MNLLDLVIVATFAAAALGGYRIGFLARIFSWAGLLAGALVANHFLPDVIGLFDRSDPEIRLMAAMAFLVGATLLGQGVGLATGSVVHHLLPIGVGLRQSDRVAGSVVGAFGVLVAVWLLTPALASVPGWTATATRESALVRGISRIAPDPPDTLSALERFVSDGAFPDVFSGLRRSPDPGPPPIQGLPDAVHRRVVQSTVKIVGRACRRIQEGSGFAAAANTVVTNAHVVAGEETPMVETYQGERLKATVVVFDADVDLAVLRVPGLGQPPLAVGDAEEGENGAVYGHPGGGDLRSAPASISEELTAVGRDIYDDHDTRRDIYVLGSNLQPGDSGAALVDVAGAVVGVAFAIAPDRPGVSYALTDAELRPVLARAAGAVPVDAGDCLAG
ncbi:MAG: MarP family serine protease [Acidimicrobiia bacterium]